MSLLNRLAEHVAWNISSIRDLEEELMCIDGPSENPSWPEACDDLAEVQKQAAIADGFDHMHIQKLMGWVWEAGYSDYVSEEECLDGMMCGALRACIEHPGR